MDGLQGKQSENALKRVVKKHIKAILMIIIGLLLLVLFFIYFNLPIDKLTERIDAGSISSIRMWIDLTLHPEVINKKDRNGWTMLHVAAMNDNVRMASVLLDRGANPNVQDEDGWAPISSTNNKQIFDLLLKKGANLLLKSNGANRQYTAMMHRTNHLIVKEMLNKLPHYEKEQVLKSNPIHSYVGYQSYNDKCEGGTVDVYLSNGVNINSVNEFGDSPLIKIVRSSSEKRTNFKLIKYLIAKGANINQQDRKGRSSLHIAVENGNYKLSRFLTRNGIISDLKDINGKTPFDYALKTGRKDIVSIFSEGKGIAIDGSVGEIKR